MASVSTYIPVRNMEKTLGRAMSSVCEQTSPPIEFTIIDDHSEDGTYKVAQTFASQYPFVKVIQHAEKSPDWMLAMHQLYKDAKGDYIHSFSGDDWVEPDFYRTALCQGKIVEEYWGKPLGILMCDWQVCDEHGKKLGIAPCGYCQPTSFPEKSDLIKAQLTKARFYEGGPACLVRKDLLLKFHDLDFHKLGPWNDSMGYSVAAWLEGTVYIPKVFGSLTFRKDSFNEEAVKDNDLAVKLYREVIRFLGESSLSLPMDLRAALARKVYGRLSLVQRLMLEK